MTVKTIAALEASITADLADNTSGLINAEDVRSNMFDTVDTLKSGWADYSDSTYTSGSPLSLVANTDTLLPNDGVNGVKTYEPDGITLYDTSTSKITGITGESRLITLSCNVLPTNASTTLIEFWLDIGGGVGELYRRLISFPKGNGVVRPITITTFAYTLDTWEANGASVYVNANNTADIYDIRYVIGRTTIV